MVFFITGVSSMLRRGEHQQVISSKILPGIDFFFSAEDRSIGWHWTFIELE